MTSKLLRRLGLARLIRAGVAASVPPLWAEIALLHYRGSFQSPPMWVPIVALPLVMVGGAASTIIPNESRSRAWFRPFAWLMFLVGAVGTLFHIRGVARQMGGFSNWKVNVVTGPPIPAPPQVALLGLAGILASAPTDEDDTATLVAVVRGVEALSYVLLAVEAGYNHWWGGFYKKEMYIPVTLGPALTTVHLGALAGSKTAKQLETPLSLAAVVAGIAGVFFHIRNLRRRPGGIRWQTLFYGAPVIAPLQLTGQGLLGLLAAAFDEEKPCE